MKCTLLAYVAQISVYTGHEELKFVVTLEATSRESFPQSNNFGGETV